MLSVPRQFKVSVVERTNQSNIGSMAIIYIQYIYFAIDIHTVYILYTDNAFQNCYQPV